MKLFLIRDLRGPGLLLLACCLFLLTPRMSIADEAMAETTVALQPWEYQPYRVLVWVAANDPSYGAASLAEPLQTYLQRDFAAIWRTKIVDAPAAIRSAVFRDMEQLDFETMVASDPVIAVKKNHPDAIRIRFLGDVIRYVTMVHGTVGRIEEVQQGANESEQPTLRGLIDKLIPVPGDAATAAALWSEESTEALLMTRGMATELRDPEAKLISLPLGEGVAEVAEAFDKVFLLQLVGSARGTVIRVVELDTLMHYLGPVVETSCFDAERLVSVIGQALTDAFSPTIRIESSSSHSATGLLRAGGLILDPHSPGWIQTGDVVVPMYRKDDSHGTPIQVGPIEWAYLLVKETEGSKLQLELHAGREGGIPGRRNSRTYQTGLQVPIRGPATVLRLHAQGAPQEPLVGYEVHERKLDSSEMTFVGRTDWDGRMLVERTADPLRLLYVKNGGAVLARLPIVPGSMPLAVADLSGDDVRLQAEAYIRGVQSAIVDLVAIRELLRARILLRLEQGKLAEAEEMLDRLRDQPTNERIAKDMSDKQRVYLDAVGRSAAQRQKIDQMFATTRELLSKYISPRLVRELEAELGKARPL